MERAELIRRLFARREVSERKPSPKTLSGRCWNWTGARQSGDDYGKISIDGVTRYTHRVSAHLWLGLPLDSPLFVRHRCRGNHACFQPQHLLIGTQAENNRDTVEHGRNRNAVLDERLISDLIWGVRKGRITIGKWAVVKRVAYKTAYNAYHGIWHTDTAAKIHARCDSKFGNSANPLLNPRPAPRLTAPAGCHFTPAGLIVVDPVAAGISRDEVAVYGDSIPF